MPDTISTSSKAAKAAQDISEIRTLFYSRPASPSPQSISHPNFWQRHKTLSSAIVMQHGRMEIQRERVDVICRDSYGQVLVGGVFSVSASSALECRGWAIRMAGSFAASIGHGKISVESDNSILVAAILNSTNVPHTANAAADWVVRAADKIAEQNSRPYKVLR